MSPNLIMVIDIDGTLTDVGNRFIDCPPPAVKLRSNPAYVKWLDEVQTEEKLLQDKPIQGMQAFVKSFKNVIYLTSREEKHRAATVKWLKLHDFPLHKLIMRPPGNEELYYQFKKDEIENFSSLYDNVMVIDDDPEGELEKVCKAKSWTFLKARSGGIVL